MLSLVAFLFINLFALFFGGMVLSRDYRRKSNRLFFIWVLLINFWTTANYLEEETYLADILREFFLRADFAVAIVGGAILLLFVLNFPKQTTTDKRDWIYSVPALFLALLSFSEQVLSNVQISERGEMTFVENWGGMVYGVVLVGYFGIAFAILAIKYYREKNIHLKGQMKVILGGLVLTLVIATTINLFFQNVLSVEAFRFGIYSFAFFILATAYAIVRHEFLQIRFIVVEFMLLGILATLLAQMLVAETATSALVALGSAVVMLVLGFQLVGSVIKEIKQREELEVMTKKLAKANQKLKELDQTKTTFLSVASHQLRTPLAITKGYLMTLQQGMLGKLAPKQQKAVETLAKSNNELVALVNELLDLSRIESGRLVTEIIDVDLLPIVDEIFAFFQPKAMEKKIKFIWNRPKGKLMVKADPEKVKEVVKNFIDNGLKYTEKGKVVVSAGMVGKQAYYRVEDTGYGMTQEDMGQLFEKFATGSASKKVKISSGFGLFVVKNIVEAMGGTVSGTSAGPGKGSTFEARFKLVS